MKAWLSSVKSRLFRQPIIYTGGAWVTFAGMYPDYADAFSDYKLWRPGYNATGCVRVPPGFKSENVVIQQYTSSAELTGVRGPTKRDADGRVICDDCVDLNTFRGNYQQLIDFAKSSRSYPWWLWALGFTGLAAAGAGIWYYSERGKLPWT